MRENLLYEINGMRPVKRQNEEKKSTTKSSLSSTSSANKSNNIEERNNNQLCNNNIIDVTVNDNVLLKTLDDCNDDTMSMHPSIH